MNKKVVAIIQARLGSTRLPGKVLMDINGNALLWHIFKRVSFARTIDKLIIATSTNHEDDKIEKFAQDNGFPLYRGSAEDCLDRYYKAASKFNADIVVRITGDCPLICPGIIDKVVSGYLKGEHDYASNTIIYTYPDGCDVEVFSFDALEKAWEESSDPISREHVTPYIRNSGKFKIISIENESPVNPEEYKWSVDNIKDLEFVREVYRYLYKGSVFTYQEIIKLLNGHPEIKLINANSIANEGYYKSISRSESIKQKVMKINESLRLKKKAEKLIPDCSQTFSKGPSQFVQGVSPSFIKKGNGCYVWDVDGNKFIDYSMALGTVILGYNYPAVTKAVKKQLEDGTIFSLPHPLEIEVAELLVELIPCAEMVRFGKNGSDVTSAAVRLARAYTGRDKIVCCGYHGWQDWYIGTTTRDKGVPEEVKKLTLAFEYNNIESLKQIFNRNKNDIAAVIMEPVGIIEPLSGFLEEVREITNKYGTLLIFDEVITGFRLSLGGAQEYFNVTPDLACFGKAMGNGFPISAIVGKKEIMKLFGEVFFSFTFGGETSSLAAAKVTINELKDKKAIAHIWEQGRKLRDGYNVLAKEHGLESITSCIGLPCRTVVNFKNQNGEDDLLLKSLFQQECIKRGVLFTGGHNICFSHSNRDIENTLKVYSSVFEIVKNAIKEDKVDRLLEGEPVKPIFRKP